jgi:hypothetical protein
MGNIENFIDGTDEVRDSSPLAAVSRDSDPSIYLYYVDRDSRLTRVKFDEPSSLWGAPEGVSAAGGVVVKVPRGSGLAVVCDPVTPTINHCYVLSSDSNAYVDVLDDLTKGIPKESMGEEPADPSAGGCTDAHTDAPTDGCGDAPTDAPADGSTDVPLGAPAHGYTDAAGDVPTDAPEAAADPLVAPTDVAADELAYELTADPANELVHELAHTPKAAATYDMTKGLLADEPANAIAENVESTHVLPATPVVAPTELH